MFDKFSLSARRRSTQTARVVVLALAALSTAKPGFSQASIWTNSETPGSAQVSNDTASVNVGLKFNSDVAGSVVAVRFFKGPNNKGPHTVNLWSATGQKLAETQTGSETSTGWQQVSLPTPVKIAAKTDYVVSYLAGYGSYAFDGGYTWSTRNHPPLRPSGGSPGVFAYGRSAAFPNSSWNSSNYWVDVLFVADGSAGNSSATYSISGKVSGAKTSLSLSGAAAASVSTDASGNYTFSSLKNGTYLVVPSSTGYSFSPSSAGVTVNGANIASTNFVATAIPASPSRSVVLSWNGSASLNIRGYQVYRSTLRGGPYSLLNSSIISNLTYTDSTVDKGKTYYYVSTAVDSTGAESGYSNETAAVVPNQ